MTSSMFTFTSLDEPQEPRRFRIGGYCISNKVAVQWASRLVGKELDPETDDHAVGKAILPRVYSHGLNFRQVGDVEEFPWMLISQEAKFNGHTHMDPSEIPQFEPNELDARAEKLLKEAGIQEYEFATTLD